MGDLFPTEYRRNINIKQPLLLWSQDYGPYQEDLKAGYLLNYSLSFFLCAGPITA